MITTKASDAKYHTVKAGQNLTVIAKMYGTTINAILKMNPSITNKNVIKVGAKIRVKIEKYSTKYSTKRKMC